MKKIYNIKQDYIGTRLDRWIRKNIFNLPQSLIEKSLRKGEIKVNDKKVKSLYKLQLNDNIILNNFNYTPDINKKKTHPYTATRKELKESSKIFIEDNENFVVINKPSGIAVQSGTKSRRNILDILRDTGEFEGKIPYPVHRIDKETTGILIVAKNRKYAQLFTTLFRIRKIHKIYLGIVLGELENRSGTLIDTLFHYEGDRKIASKAITHYKVIDSNNNYSLLRLSPETGRKHQLRKQLMIHGHPILGDLKYRISDKHKNNNSQLMLHAYKINFTINELKYNFLAELPIIFRSTLNEKYLKIS